MASLGLPTNIDATHFDSTADPGVKAHQQAHDKLHGWANKFDVDAVRQQGAEMVWNETAQLWAPRDAPTFNVKDFGAKGDGVTNDTAAIQACFTAARAASGGGMCDVFFPRGTYMIGSVLNPGLCRLWGYSATIKIMPGVTGFTMMTSTSQRYDICGLTIDGNKANTTSPGTGSNVGIGARAVRTSTPSGLIARWIDMQVVNTWGPAVRAEATAQFDAENALATRAVVDRLVTDNCRWGVYLSGLRDAQVQNCTITNTGFNGISEGNCRGSRIIANQILGVTESHGLSSQYSYNTLADGNTCNNTQFGGILFGGGSPTFAPGRYMRVNNNHCEFNYHHGISFDTTLSDASGVSQPVHATVNGNVLRDNGWVAGNGQGLYLHNARYVTANGNEAYHNRGAGIALDGSDIAAAGNVCTDNGKFGMELRAEDSTAADHGRFDVGANTCHGNGSIQAGGVNVQWDIYTSPLLIDSPVALSGSGSPEGVYTGGRGSTFRRIDGGAGTTFYVKESSAAVTTGWVAK